MVLDKLVLFYPEKHTHTQSLEFMSTWTMPQWILPLKLMWFVPDLYMR